MVSTGGIVFCVESDSLTSRVGVEPNEEKGNDRSLFFVIRYYDEASAFTTALNTSVMHRNH